MSYSLSFLAVRGKVTHLILEELHLRRTGEREAVAKAMITGVELPTGCYVITAHQNTELMHDAMLAQLSLECECYACFVDEQMKVTSAVGWKNGKKVWTALHDGGKGSDHLQLRGEFPSLFGPILEGGKALQKSGAASALFNVPVELVAALTGYRYDRAIPGLGTDAFEVLTRAQSKEKSVISRVLGGK